LNNILPTKDNTQTPILYKPRIEDLTGLQEKISQKYNVAVVYGGYFNTGNTGSNLTVENETGFIDPDNWKFRDDPDAWRALQTLGFDMYLYEDKLDRANSADPLQWKVEQKFLSLDSDTVTKRFAIMAMYKALGKNIVTMDVTQKPNAEGSPYYIAPDNLPIMEKITVPVDRLDHSKGFSYVYASRTNWSSYWERAMKDSVLLKDDYEAFKETAIVSEEEQAMTTLEFCFYLRRLLYHYGETVLTEQEENYLLEAYGRYLPASVEAKYLESIRYLVARGIIEADMNFFQPLTFRDMLVILMRAADEESRLTFKNIEIEYDKTLISQGYFPTEVSVPVGLTIEREPENYSTKAYYDFFVEVPSGTQDVWEGEALNIKPENRDMFVSDSLYGVEGIAESSYYGVETMYANKFYHFRVPVATQRQAVYVKAYGSKVNGAYLKIPDGGGYYYMEDNYNVRHSFSATDNASWVDADRKKQGLVNPGSTPLAPEGESSVVVGIPYELTDTATFNGEKLSDILGEEAERLTPQTEGGVGKIIRYKFNKLSKVSEVRDKLKVDTSSYQGNAVQFFQIYVTLGDKNNMFVNVEYLKSCGIIEGYTEIEEDVLLLYGPQQTVILDKKQHRIISGNVVIDTAITSRLWTKSMNQLLIDYRAVIGWTSDYLLVSDEEGRVNIVPIEDENNVHSEYLRSPFGQTLQSVLVDKPYQEDDRSILLMGTDALAPYIIYRNQKAGPDKSRDWIYSFKTVTNSGDYVNKNPESKSTAATNLQFNLPDTLWVVESRLSPVAGVVVNPKGIGYTEHGYVFTPSPKSDFDPAIHYGQASENLPGSAFIPYFMSDKDTYNRRKILNFNMNIAYDIGSGQDYPYGQMTQPYTEVGVSEKALLNAKDWSIASSDADYSMTGLKAAPVAMWLYATSIQNVSVEEALKANSTEYFGTLRATMKETSSYDREVYTLYAQKFDKKPVASGFDRKELLFRPVLWGMNGSVLIYDSYDVQPVHTEEKKKPGTTSNERQAIFDFEGFMFGTFLQGLDDSMTVTVIFILNLIPRVFMFLFLVLMALACIARAPVWRKFCASVFDPYKVITAGRQSCETIELVPLFISSMVALGLFGLFQNGLILDLIGWIVRAVTGILSR
jgi:hypothetical protein